MKLLAATLAAVSLLTVSGCGDTVRARRVPDVTDERLDVAEGRLDDAGLRYETVGGGLFGVVVRSHWIVCEQEPEPGRVATRVELYVSRDCWDR